MHGWQRDSSATLIITHGFSLKRWNFFLNALYLLSSPLMYWCMRAKLFSNHINILQGFFFCWTCFYHCRRDYVIQISMDVLLINSPLVLFLFTRSRITEEDVTAALKYLREQRVISAGENFNQHTSSGYYDKI